MTTIAYSHKQRQIAYDSREVAGSTILSDTTNKMHKHGDEIHFFCGAKHDFNSFLEFHRVIGEQADRPIECSSFMYRDGRFYKCSFDEDLVYWEVELEADDAIGSGWKWALAALDHGKTAKEALKYAIRRDIYTGGTVKVFKGK